MTIKLSHLDKFARDYPFDSSLFRLTILAEDGYVGVKWKSSPNAGTSRPGVPSCKCANLNSTTWPLEIFMKDISHDAPIFGRAHVGCKCSVIVSGPDLPDVEIFAVE